MIDPQEMVEEMRVALKQRREVQINVRVCPSAAKAIDLICEMVGRHSTRTGMAGAILEYALLKFLEWQVGEGIDPPA